MPNYLSAECTINDLISAVYMILTRSKGRWWGVSVATYVACDSGRQQVQRCKPVAGIKNPLFARGVAWHGL